MRKLILIGSVIVFLILLAVTVFANWDDNTCMDNDSCLIQVLPIDSVDNTLILYDANCTIFVENEAGTAASNLMVNRTTGFHDYNVSVLSPDEYWYKVACNNYWVDSGYFRINETTRYLIGTINVSGSVTADIDYQNIWAGVWNYTGEWGRYIYGMGG